MSRPQRFGVAPGKAWMTAVAMRRVIRARRIPSRCTNMGMKPAESTKPAPIATAHTVMSAMAPLMSDCTWNRLRYPKIIATEYTPNSTRWAPISVRECPTSGTFPR